MSTPEFLTLMIVPVGSLLIGGWVYWIGTRGARKDAEHTRGE